MIYLAKSLNIGRAEYSAVLVWGLFNFTRIKNRGANAGAKPIKLCQVYSEYPDFPSPKEE